MLEYDRIDLSESIDTKNVKKRLENVVHENFIIF